MARIKSRNFDFLPQGLIIHRLKVAPTYLHNVDAVEGKIEAQQEDL